jgi:putative DNA primase/helicase
VQRADRNIIAVQVTWLDSTGRGRAKDRNRKTLGKLGSGAVRLGSVDDVIGLSEGTETALSAMQLFGVPCWSCLGSNRMDAVTIPASVRKVIIYADNDKPGELAFRKSLATYWPLHTVDLKLPADGCGDFNEELLANLGVCDE